MERIVKLPDLKLFDSMLEIKFGDRCLDIHNDYNCRELSYQDNILSLHFINVSNSETLKILFSDTKILKMDFEFSKQAGFTVLDNFYRGRFELNGRLCEISDDGRGYMYVEFYEGYKIEFLSREMKINVEAWTS
jgi:hypothetical protein